MVHQHQVVVVAGDTGCGKSTQVNKCISFLYYHLFVWVVGGNIQHFSNVSIITMSGH